MTGMVSQLEVTQRLQFLKPRYTAWLNNKPEAQTNRYGSTTPEPPRRSIAWRNLYKTSCGKRDRTDPAIVTIHWTIILNAWIFNNLRQSLPSPEVARKFVFKLRERIE
jgi:hypothetical protein